MPDLPLTLTGIFDHGRRYFADSAVLAHGSDGTRRSTFAEVATEADRLAAGLASLGLAQGDRVATFCWNNLEHLSAYFAVPCGGWVLHTLNIRLFADQLSYVINHAEDRVIIVDASLASKISEIAPALTTVEWCIVIGEGPVDAEALPGTVLRFADVLGDPSDGYPWPDLAESSAASMCYTSGTTGNPRGVAYSHRSTFLHTLAQCSGNGFALSERDRVLLVVPMFHANAWGLPYSAWMVGADLILPGELLQATPLAAMLKHDRPTFVATVPAIYNDLLAYGERADLDLSSLRLAQCGGAPVPAHLIEAMRDRYGVTMLQGWGMTETSPLAALAHPPKGTPEDEETAWRTKSGKPIAGVQMRITDTQGIELPWDGVSLGEIEVRGPWVTSSYYRDDAPDRFRDGWLRTGDVGYGDANGYVQLTDRTKDVIKSGGEWISSVELENTLMGNPDVLEAAVVAVPDARWDERPLACIVLHTDSHAGPEQLVEWLQGRVARWWVPERWAVVEEIPKTSVGKFDKKELRARYAVNALKVTRLGG